jgi:hypothetical protein
MYYVFFFFTDIYIYIYIYIYMHTHTHTYCVYSPLLGETKHCASLCCSSSTYFHAFTLSASMEFQKVFSSKSHLNWSWFPNSQSIGVDRQNITILRWRYVEHTACIFLRSLSRCPSWPSAKQGRPFTKPKLHHPDSTKLYGTAAFQHECAGKAQSIHLIRGKIPALP